MKQLIGWTFLFLSVVPAQAAGPRGHHDDPDPEKHQRERAAPDTRILIAYPDTIKPFFLETMRQNLADISEIQRALAESDFDRAAVIAENNLGLGGRKTHDALASHMPKEMRVLGMEFHKESSRLALTLKEKNTPKIFDQLSRVTGVCVMCHAMYRVN